TGGPWFTEAVPSYNGTERYAASSGTGSNTATWQVPNLEKGGVFQVDVTWHPYSNEPTNAPYAIYDRSTLVKNVVVDQTQTPVGPQYGGVPFQTLAGAVKILNGTLNVVVSNTGNGKWVVADAVRLSAVPVSNTDLNWSATGDGITGPATTSIQTPFT